MITKLTAVATLLFAVAGCQKPAEAPAAAAAISEADANAQADSMVRTWESKDAAKIKALYAPDVVAFDYANGPLEADRATFDKAQDVFAAAAIDHENQVSRKIQILGADTFVMWGTTVKVTLLLTWPPTVTVTGRVNTTNARYCGRVTSERSATDRAATATRALDAFKKASATSSISAFTCISAISVSKHITVQSNLAASTLRAHDSHRCAGPSGAAGGR